MSKAAEFILEFESKQVLVLEPFGPYYEDVVKRLSEQPDLQTIECSSLKEMAVLGRQIGVCVMLAHCPDERYAPAIVALLEFCRNEIKNRKIRILITVSEDFIFLLPRFIREGANEVVPQPISPKDLYSKIDRYLDILPSRDQNGKLLPPHPRPKGTGDDLSPEPQVTWQVPLALKSDCWTTIEGKTRWASGTKKWSVSLVGPPPLFGEWATSSHFPGEKPSPPEPCWEWQVNDVAADLFHHEEGAWKFRGEKPEFKDGAWVFAGHNPKLAFYHSEKNKGAKVEGEEHVLRIAEDSDHGKFAAELIEQALRKQAGMAFTVKDEVTLHSWDAQIPAEIGTVSVVDESPREPEFIVNPLAAAFLVSEIMRNRSFTPLQMLGKFCEFLKSASGGGNIEFWMTSSNDWVSIQHDGPVNAYVKGKLNNTSSSEMVRHEDNCAVPIFHGKHRLGALVASGVKAEAYTEFELVGFAAVLDQIVIAACAEKSNQRVA